MSLHSKVSNIINHQRAKLLDLKRLARDDVHRAGLDAILSGLDGLLELANETLTTKLPEHDPRPSYGFEGVPAGGRFLVDGAKIASLRASASAYGRRHGQTWVVRKQIDGSALCIRVK